MEFDWDEHNIGHIARHGVTPEEFEQVIRNEPVPTETRTVDGETRLLGVGHTDEGRVLVVVTTGRGARIRPVTAWEGSRAVRSKYKETRKTQ